MLVKTHLVSPSSPARIKAFRVLIFVRRKCSEQLIDAMFRSPCLCVCKLLLRLHRVKASRPKESTAMNRSAYISLRERHRPLTVKWGRRAMVAEPCLRPETQVRKDLLLRGWPGRSRRPVVVRRSDVRYDLRGRRRGRWRWAR